MDGFAGKVRLTYAQWSFAMIPALRSSGPIGSPPNARFWPRRPALAVAPLVLAAGLLCPAAVAAQQDTTWRSLDTLRLARPPHNATHPPDFLFEEPRASLDLRVGVLFPRAGSDVFQETMQQLMLSRSDLNALVGGVDLGFRLRPRLDALLGVAVSHAGKTADIRASQCGGLATNTCVDNNDVPLQEHTTFTQVPITAGLRAHLLPRGEQIGHFVWVPARFAPYVGAAAGMVYYKFARSGDFVGPAPDYSVFTDDVEAHGWKPMAQVLGGVDVRLSRHAAIKAEARYSWATGGVSPGFTDFSGVDLAGLQTTLGLSWRY